MISGALLAFGAMLLVYLGVRDRGWDQAWQPALTHPDMARLLYPAQLTLLVGLGLTEFSMTPGAIGVAKQVLSEVRSDDLRQLARRIRRLATVDEIERELLASLPSTNRSIVR